MTFLVPKELETSRLQLRMFAERDWESLCIMFSDPECVKYTRGTPERDWETWRRLASYIGHWELRGYGPYAVVEKASEQLIGTVGLWYPGDWPEPEIKWSLVRASWGKGFATEAAWAVKAMAAQQLKWSRLISLILPENVPSKAVAERIGGVYEKTIPFRDRKADIFVYTLGQ